MESVGLIITPKEPIKNPYIPHIPERRSALTDMVYLFFNLFYKIGFSEIKISYTVIPILCKKFALSLSLTIDSNSFSSNISNFVFLYCTFTSSAIAYGI